MLSLKTLHVGLAAERLVLAEVSGAWRRRVTACDSLKGLEAPEAEPWRPAVAALAGRLGKQRGTGAALRVVLSGRMVRWQLLPWRPELANPREFAAYAALRFRETFGGVADAWRILPAPQPPGGAAPACAVDAGLLDALRGACEGAGLRLVEVTPYFASAFDHWRAVLGGKTAWFGLLESDCLSLGLLRGGRWAALRAQRLKKDWREELPGMMAQLGVCAGLGDAAAPLYLAGGGDEPPAGGPPFVWLRPAARLGAAGCRMALGV